jgi:exonuclease III
MLSDTKSHKEEIKSLRKKIRLCGIPAPSDNNFRLLTWNIRNLNKNKEDRAIACIAEICKNFDIIAIQEAKKDLGGLEKLQRALGKRYRFLFSDVAGNSERLVFVYDSERVQFTGLAAEIVMAPGAGRDNVKPELEFDRTPFMASFRINGCNFIVVTVHIYYGSGSAVKYRLEEIRNVAKYLEKNSTDTDALDSDYIACGDFNIERVKTKMSKNGRTGIIDELFAALRSGGLIIDEIIQNSPSNLSRTKHFDQIGYHRYKDSTIEFQTGGTIDFTDAVYVGDPKVAYKLTDHLPMWASFLTSKDKNPKYINP